MRERLRYVWLRTLNALRMIGKGEFRRLGRVIQVETVERVRAVPSSRFSDPTRPSPTRIRPTSLQPQPPPKLRADRERLAAGIKELRNSIEIEIEIENEIESEIEPEKADHP
jgi:hypothetical protein